MKERQLDIFGGPGQVISPEPAAKEEEADWPPAGWKLDAAIEFFHAWQAGDIAEDVGGDHETARQRLRTDRQLYEMIIERMGQRVPGWEKEFDDPIVPMRALERIGDTILGYIYPTIVKLSVATDERGASIRIELKIGTGLELKHQLLWAEVRSMLEVGKDGVELTVLGEQECEFLAGQLLERLKDPS